jgi:hypothetical protein
MPPTLDIGETGRVAGAMVLLEHVATERERVLDLHHPDMLGGRGNLALSLPGVRSYRRGDPARGAGGLNRERLLDQD